MAKADSVNREFLLDGPIIDEEPCKPLCVINDKGTRIPYIICRYCETKIKLCDKMHLQSIPCPKCKVEIPLRYLPEGQRYVRCKCKRLMFCKVTTKKINCHDKHCKEVIVIPSLYRALTVERYECWNCTQTIEASQEETFAHCKCCNRESSLGRDHIKWRLTICVVLGLFFAGGTVLFAVKTHELASEGNNWPIYIGWGITGMVATILFLKLAIYLKIKTSARIHSINR